MATNYARGRAFEYRARDQLYADGALYVVRAAGSHTKADLVAFFEPKGAAHRVTRVWLVQCKRDGRLPRQEREELRQLADSVGAHPVLAKAGPKGRGVVFDRITSQRSTSV